MIDHIEGSFLLEKGLEQAPTDNQMEHANHGVYEIKNGEGVHMKVQLHGGYINELTDSSGAPLLLKSYQLPGGKVRGGSHVCEPWGQSFSIDVPQHGFGRLADWKIASAIKDNPSNTITMQLTPEELAGLDVPSNYAGMSMTRSLTVAWLQNGETVLHTKLVVRNGGEEPFVSSPGEHHYFDLGGETATNVPFNYARGQFKCDADHLKASQQLPRDPSHEIEFKTKHHNVKVMSDDMPVFVVWTDQPHKYICVEPTRSGVLPVGKPDQMSKITLQPGQEQTYESTTVWTPLHR